MADQPDFIGSGWTFPLGVNARGGIALSRSSRGIEDAMRIVLGTPIGERRMRPEFGCAIHDLTFATNDPTTHGLIRHHVQQALALWEPRIEVYDIRVGSASDDPAKVLIDIEYVLRATNERRNLVYPFYVIPGEP
ncbi:MAG: GPW/gp25 family protein [Chloroflexota bacterium]